MSKGKHSEEGSNKFVGQIGDNSRRRKIYVNNNYKLTEYKRRRRKADGRNCLPTNQAVPMKLSQKTSFAQELARLVRGGELEVAAVEVEQTRAPNHHTRHKTRMVRNHSKLKKLATFSLIIATSLQLLCDIQFASFSLPRVACEQDSEAFGQIRQRFVEEPRDMDVLVGQPAEISCLIENKSGPLSWLRDNFAFSRDSTVHAPYSERYSLPQANQAESNNLQELAELANYTSNYSLHISNVTIRDDATFQCRLEARGEQRKSISSRGARINVLKAPTMLTLLAENLTSAAPYEPSAKLELVEIQHHHQSALDGPPYRRPTTDLSAQTEPEVGHAPNSTSAARTEATEATATAASLNASSWEFGPDNSYISEINKNASVLMLVVRQNDRIRLDCQSDGAKPHAELVWLDQHQQPIPKKPQDSPLVAAFVEENVWALEGQPKLSRASLSLYLTVQRHHSSGFFTCVARHQAFELMDRQADPFSNRAHQLLRRVKLEVEYEPEVELVKNQTMPAYENLPVGFECRAQAKPSHNLRYRWFLDNKLVVGAEERELRVGQLSRQLHLRQIACEVSNEIGRSLKEMRVGVLYAPAYVTHLLPASLQPPLPSEEAPSSRRLNGSLPSPGEPADGGAREQPLSERRLALARQLAIGYTPNQEVELRCDFDSNPRLQNILWYKISSDLYDEMQDVSPSQADQLIAFGLNRAIFRRGPSQQLDEEFPSEPATQRRHSKALVSEDELRAETLDQLDYTKMSEELLSELERLQQNATGNGSERYPRRLEQLQNSAIRATNPQIYESLDWSLARRLAHSADSLEATHSSDLLTLRRPPLSSPSVKLNKRESQVSSSSYSFRSAPEEAMGLYVCRSKSSLPENVQPSVARSVFLVPRKRVRIVSLQEQFAPADLSASPLQLECLVTTYTVAEITIEWHKDGKIITPSSVEGRNVSIEQQYSPDLLFKRSLLRITRPNKADLGQYHCVAYNLQQAEEKDSMPIELKAIDAKGLIMVMATGIASAILLLGFCLLGLSTALSRRSTLDKAKKMAHFEIHKESPSNMTGNVDELDAAAGRAKSSDAEREQSQRVSSMVMFQQPTGEPLSSLHQEQDQSSDHSSHANSNQLLHRGPGNSQLRLSRSLAVGPNCSTKFQAIHESLENRLNLSLPPSLAPNSNGANYSSNSLTQANLGLQQASTGISDSDMATGDNQVNSAEGQAPSSLMNRFMSRLLMRPASIDAAVIGARRRPDISSPILQDQQAQADQQASQTGRKRSGSSASHYKARQLITGSLPDANRCSHNRLLRLTNGNSNGQVISSSANLISDSTTGSDGSSRSSSSSGQHKHINETLRLQTFPEYQFNPSGQQQPPWQARKILVVNEMSQYANEPAPIYLQSELPSVYSNNLYPAPEQTQLVSNQAYIDTPYMWQPQDNHLHHSTAPLGHYQLPTAAMAPNEPYAPPTTCYSSLCTDFHNQAFVGPVGAAYATSLGPQINTPTLLPTSDNGDAFFEKNYGTLLSSAYKALAYNQEQPIDNSASSSPNSLTTQQSNNPTLFPIPPNGKPLDSFTNSKQQAEEQVAIVSSNGSKTTTTAQSATNLKGDINLATHV